MNRQDIGALRTPLIAFVIALTLSACVIVHAVALMRDAQALLTRGETQLRNERLRAQDALQDRTTMADYAGAYGKLVRAGIAGEEQRMNWLDALRAASQHAHSFGVEYDIGAQRAYTYISEVNAGSLKVNESPMQIRLRLLHEGDLFRFFDALADTASGFFSIDRCIVRRVTHDSDRTAQTRENLASECEVRWLTVRPATTPDRK